MKAIRIHEYGDAGALKLEDVPRLSIADNQILVRVHDAGVNPIDWKIREGHMRQILPVNFPYTIGQDFAGEVADRGKSAGTFNIGDRVFGFAQGTYAEYVAATISDVARIHDSIDYAAAAALPTAGSTALQLIRDVAQAKPGMNILIHGAAGGVGSFATQIARKVGAHVIGTATGADIEYLKSLGVDRVIDYKNERFEDKVGRPDIVIDLVGGETQARSYSVVKRGGTLVTTVQSPDEQAAKKAGIRALMMRMQRKASDLFELAQLVAEGSVKPRLGHTMSLTEAKRAQEMSEKGRTHGKVILKVA